MERLTKMYLSGAWGISGSIDEAVLKLAAYEDTGFEPQEIKSLQAEWQANLKVLESYRELGVPVDRLRELVEADRGGRCGDIKNRCAIKVGNNKYNEIIVTGESQEVLAIISDTVVVVKNGIAVAFKD